MRQARIFALVGVLALLASSCTPPSDDSQKVAELQKQVEELKTENAKLRSENSALRSQDEALDQKEVKAKYTREEFKKLVMGKTKDQVMNAVGRPESTSERGDTEFWYYTNMTYDPISQKVGSRVQIVFEEGLVEYVNF